MNRIKLFENIQVRTVWNETEQKGDGVGTDVIQVLTDRTNPGDYLKKCANGTKRGPTVTVYAPGASDPSNTYKLKESPTAIAVRPGE